MALSATALPDIEDPETSPSTVAAESRRRGQPVRVRHRRSAETIPPLTLQASGVHRVDIPQTSRHGLRILLPEDVSDNPLHPTHSWAGNDHEQQQVIGPIQSTPAIAQTVEQWPTVLSRTPGYGGEGTGRERSEIDHLRTDQRRTGTIQRTREARSDILWGESSSTDLQFGPNLTRSSKCVKKTDFVNNFLTSVSPLDSTEENSMLDWEAFNEDNIFPFSRESLSASNLRRPAHRTAPSINLNLPHETDNRAGNKCSRTSNDWFHPFMVSCFEAIRSKKFSSPGKVSSRSTDVAHDKHLLVDYPSEETIGLINYSNEVGTAETRHQRGRWKNCIRESYSQCEWFLDGNKSTTTSRKRCLDNSIQRTYSLCGEQGMFSNASGNSFEAEKQHSSKSSHPECFWKSPSCTDRVRSVSSISVPPKVSVFEPSERRLPQNMKDSWEETFQELRKKWSTKTKLSLCQNITPNFKTAPSPPVACTSDPVPSAASTTCTTDSPCTSGIKMTYTTTNSVPDLEESPVCLNGVKSGTILHVKKSDTVLTGTLSATSNNNEDSWNCSFRRRMSDSSVNTAPNICNPTSETRSQNTLSCQLASNQIETWSDNARLLSLLPTVSVESQVQRLLTSRSMHGLFGSLYYMTTNTPLLPTVSTRSHSMERVLNSIYCDPRLNESSVSNFKIKLGIQKQNTHQLLPTSNNDIAEDVCKTGTDFELCVDLDQHDSSLHFMENLCTEGQSDNAFRSVSLPNTSFEIRRKSSFPEFVDEYCDELTTEPANESCESKNTQVETVRDIVEELVRSVDDKIARKLPFEDHETMCSTQHCSQHQDTKWEVISEDRDRNSQLYTKSFMEIPKIHSDAGKLAYSSKGIAHQGASAPSHTQMRREFMPGAKITGSRKNCENISIYHQVSKQETTDTCWNERSNTSFLSAPAGRMSSTALFSDADNAWSSTLDEKATPVTSRHMSLHEVHHHHHYHYHHYYYPFPAGMSTQSPSVGATATVIFFAGTINSDKGNSFDK